MTQLTQQELLQALKDTLGVGTTWNDVADKTGIAPRTLKSYRLPVASKGARGMDKFVREAVENAFVQAQKKMKNSA